MAFVELEMRGIKEVPVSELDALSRNIRGRCDRMESRTAVFMLVSLFAKLVPVYGFRDIISTSDHMGGLKLSLHLISGDYFFKLNYEQSITESWQHVDVDRFSYDSSLPCGITLLLELDFVGEGYMALRLFNIEESVRREIITLACRLFERVRPLGLPPDNEALELIRDTQNQTESKDLPASPPAPLTPLDKFIDVLDRPRDGYMEWHDGPSLHEVDYAVSALTSEERIAASAAVSERLGKGYDPYLGRAVELLNSAELHTSLQKLIASTDNPSIAVSIARNLFVIGESVEAVDIMKHIIENRLMGWSARVEALCNLKEIIKKYSGEKNAREIITPELETVIFNAVCDDDYLVRYHAADILYKMAGNEKEISEEKELFGYICGKSGSDKKPDDADREGFKKAVEILRRL